MISEKDFEKIQKEIENFFEKTTFNVNIEFSISKENEISVKIKTEEPKILIGEKGETLSEIQHLLRIIIKRRIKTEELFHLDIDINDYKKKKSFYLKELARSVAREVILTKKETILPPMPAYERKIIHLELANNPNIETKSIGKEPERQIMIKPYP